MLASRASLHGGQGACLRHVQAHVPFCSRLAACHRPTRFTAVSRKSLAVVASFAGLGRGKKDDKGEKKGKKGREKDNDSDRFTYLDLEELEGLADNKKDSFTDEELERLKQLLQKQKNSKPLWTLADLPSMTAKEKFTLLGELQSLKRPVPQGSQLDKMLNALRDSARGGPSPTVTYSSPHSVPSPQGFSATTAPTSGPGSAAMGFVTPLGPLPKPPPSLSPAVLSGAPPITSITLKARADPNGWSPDTAKPPQALVAVWTEDNPASGHQNWFDMLLTPLPMAALQCASGTPSTALEFLKRFPLFVHPSAVETLMIKESADVSMPAKCAVGCIVATDMRNVKASSIKQQKLGLCQLPWTPNYCIGHEKFMTWTPQDLKPNFGDRGAEDDTATIARGGLTAQVVPYFSSANVTLMQQEIAQKQKLVLDRASVLWAPDTTGGTNTLGTVEHCVVAVIPWTPNSVVCWAPTKMPIQSEMDALKANPNANITRSGADTLVVVCYDFYTPTDAAAAEKAILSTKTELQSRNAFMTGQKKWGGMKAPGRDELPNPPPVSMPVNANGTTDPNCVLGPSTYQNVLHPQAAVGGPVGQERLTLIAVWHPADTATPTAGWRIFAQINYQASEYNSEDCSRLVGAGQLYPLNYISPYTASPVKTLQDALTIPKGQESYNDSDANDLGVVNAGYGFQVPGVPVPKLPRFTALAKAINQYKTLSNPAQLEKPVRSVSRSEHEMQEGEKRRKT